jgi:hypothetical protein
MQYQRTGSVASGEEGLQVDADRRQESAAECDHESVALEPLVGCSARRPPCDFDIATSS